MHDFSPKRLHQGSEQSRRSHHKKAVTSIEHAMDIAIGAEPWNEEWDEKEAA